jgi:hypothetical protein
MLRSINTSRLKDKDVNYSVSVIIINYDCYEDVRFKQENLQTRYSRTKLLAPIMPI